MAVGELLLGLNVAVAPVGPAVLVQVPMPALGTALSWNVRSHSLPPVPAFGSGISSTLFVIPDDVAIQPLELVTITSTICPSSKDVVVYVAVVPF